MTRPRRQVIITEAISDPTISGSHAPCVTLVRLEEKNETSTVRNSAPIGTSFHVAVRQIDRATARNRTVSRMKVPVTATP